jgi:oxygen-dependent protoporphyrinogen oxidase
MTVNIWYPYEGIVPRGLGYLIPDTLPFEDNPERGLGVFFDSHVGIGSGASPHDDYREPGTKLFVLLGGHYYDPNEPNSTQPPSEGQAIDQAKTLLERHLGIPRHTTCHATARLAPGCLPQHTVGHHARVSRLSAQLAQSFGNRLAAVGGSFGKPGVVPGLRAGWDAAFSVANEDFLANGLEDHTEETFLNPGWIGVGNEHE